MRLWRLKTLHEVGDENVDRLRFERSCDIYCHCWIEICLFKQLMHMNWLLFS